jgi:hypothetical protein
MAISHLYPTQRPALDLNFARQKRLDSRVTFTRGSTATYVGSDGLIKTAASGEARFDHDPETGESLGLLVEESRTNDALNSDLKSNWTISPGSNSTTEIGPDGTTVMELNGGTAGGTGNVLCTRNVTASNSGDYILSFFIKKPSGSTAAFTFVQCRFFSGSIGGGAIHFDWSDNDWSSNAQSNQSDFIQPIQNYGNGWYRVGIKTTLDSGDLTGSIRVGLSDNDNSTPATLSTDNKILIWGAQFERGSFMTSYIPTSGSTVTRSADVASLTNSSIYDTDSFTILNEPFGSAAGSSTLSLVGAGETPIKRTAVYSQDLTQTQINASVGKTDEFWRWRILGSSFGLANFTTDGQVTVDWGDGTVETLTTSDHTFTDGGGYHEVGFRLDSGTYFRPYINNNATHKNKVVAVGPAPISIRLNSARSFYGCSNLVAFDATVACNVGSTNIQSAWQGCSSLVSFPLLDFSGRTIFNNSWIFCSSLTSFPLIDTSSGTSFSQTWYDCNSLTSFPLLDTSSGTTFYRAWYGCNSLTSFPLIDTSSGTNFRETWRDCSGLTTFPANFFDSWTGTPVNNCFFNAWLGCSSLTATSVENILNSLDTSNQSAPASGVDITIDYDTGTGTPSVSTAVTNLKSRGWTITLNGVPQ